MQSRIDLQIGQSIGSYRIVRQLGTGGMGVVYEVIHQSIGRRAAIKLLTIDVGRHPELATRFINEAKAANQIQHPGVVQIYEFGQLEDGTPWLLMEFLQGETLTDRMYAVWARGMQFGRDGLILLHQLASILSATHERGIVHRDLKPGNIMLVPDPAAALGERVKLLDFGIAKLRDDSLQMVGGGRSADLRTKAGDVLGTPAYMAPEQCVSAAQTDARADVYSLGVIAFQMFSGQLPHDGDHPLAIMAKKVSTPAPRLEQFSRELPGDLPDLIASMLQPQPSQRATMHAAVQELSLMLGLGNARQSGFMGAVYPPVAHAAASSPTPPPAEKHNGTLSVVDSQILPVTFTRPAEVPAAVPGSVSNPGKQPPARRAAPSAPVPSDPAPLVSPGPSPITLLPAGRRRVRLILTACALLLSMSTVLVALLWQSGNHQTLPRRPLDLGLTHKVESGRGTSTEYLPDLAEPAAVEVPIDLAVSPDFSTAPKVSAVATSSSCTVARVAASCITSAGLTDAQKTRLASALIDSLKESGSRLCAAETLTLSLEKNWVRVKVLERSLSHEVLDILEPNLLGRLQGPSLLDQLHVEKAQIKVQCKSR